MIKLTDEQRITKIIATVLDSSEESVQESNNLKEDLNMDSLDEMDIVQRIESDFDIFIRDEDYGGFTTLQQFINLLPKI